MSEYQDEVINHFKKEKRKGQKGFKEFDEIARELTQRFAYAREINAIISEQERIAGIGFMNQPSREAAPRRGFNTESRLTYFLTKSLAKDEDGLIITYDTTLEAIMNQHEYYKHVVNWSFRRTGAEKESGYKQIIKNREITFEQEKLKNQKTIRIYPPQQKIYLLNDEVLQRINQLPE